MRVFTTCRVGIVRLLLSVDCPVISVELSYLYYDIHVMFLLLIQNVSSTNNKASDVDVFQNIVVRQRQIGVAH